MNLDLKAITILWMEILININLNEFKITNNKKLLKKNRERKHYFN